MIKIIFKIAFLLALGSCASRNTNQNIDSKLFIRIQNHTESNIDNFWLGAGPNGGATQTTAYHAIPKGSTSDYIPIDAYLPNYRKVDLVIAGKRYLGLIDPNEQLGIAALATGHYTFRCYLEAEQVIVTIIPD